MSQTYKVVQEDEEFEPYKMLEADEKIEANITAVKEEPNTMFPNEDGTPRYQLRFDIQVVEGEGKGQTYGFWVNKPLGERISPKSSLYKLAVTVFGTVDEVNADRFIGMPVTIELNEPYESSKNPGRQIQKVTAVKKSKRKKTITEADVDAVFGEQMDPAV